MTSLKSTSFVETDFLSKDDFKSDTSNKFEIEVDDDGESVDITNITVLTIEDVESVVMNSSILLLTATEMLSTEIVVTIAYVVAHAVKSFLNQSFLCVNFDFLIVNDLIFSICSELI